MLMQRNKRMVAVWAVAVFAVSFLLLAPVECVGYCEDFNGTTGVDGRCLSSCTTLLGHAGTLGPGWFSSYQPG